MNITRDFLKTFLDIPGEEFGKLTVINPALGKLSKRGKMGVVDIKLTTKSGKIVHIELQVEKTTNIRNRILYYGSRNVSDQLNWGEDYNKLHQVISIVICDHKLLDDEISYINDYELRNEQGRSFTKMLKVIIIELPKLPKTADGAIWPWLKFFKCEKKEEFKMLAKEHPEVKKAVIVAKKITFRERWRHTLLDWQIRRMDEREFKRHWREEGREEGRTEGQAQEKLKVARNLLAKGSTLDFVQEITGLSKEEILKL
jgi:predicted transposase/invertase (TIGR01784 family)